MNEQPRAQFLLGTVIASLFALTGVIAAHASDAPPQQGAPSKETREKMATLHEQMASCLRSDKSVADCHSEMMKKCQSLGSQVCPMMSKGMHDHMGMDMHDQSSKEGH